MKQEWKDAAKVYFDNLPAHTNMMNPQTTIDTFIAGAEWHNRSLNWIRDLVTAGIEKPVESVNILKRIDGLLND